MAFTLKPAYLLLAGLLTSVLILSLALFTGAFSPGGQTIDTSDYGNVTLVSADLPQWQKQGGDYGGLATFHRDNTGAEVIDGSIAFRLPCDGYTTSPIRFQGWKRDTNLTIAFNYTVPYDSYAGATSPVFLLDFGKGVNFSIDYTGETGQFLYTQFNITDPEPEKGNLENDDLSTLVPPGYTDARFTGRRQEAYDNSLNASRAISGGTEPYYTKDLYGAMKNVTAYVNRQMVSDDERWHKDPYYGDFTQSDWYIGYNASGFGPRYHGICKDYASLARSYYRSMGIPAKFVIFLANDSSGNVSSHAWLEVYDGSRWIQADPTWNLFDEPCYYQDDGYTNLQVRELSLARKQDTSVKVSTCDDLLFQAWIYGPGKGLVDFDLVVDRGNDPAYVNSSA